MERARTASDGAATPGAFVVLQVCFEGEPIDAYRPWHGSTHLRACANRQATESGYALIAAPVFATVRQAIRHAVVDDLWFAPSVQNALSRRSVCDTSRFAPNIRFSRVLLLLDVILVGVARGGDGNSLATRHAVRIVSGLGASCGVFTDIVILAGIADDFSRSTECQARSRAVGDAWPRSVCQGGSIVPFIERISDF
jgi:hypothetical protein